MQTIDEFFWNTSQTDTDSKTDLKTGLKNGFKILLKIGLRQNRTSKLESNIKISYAYNAIRIVSVIVYDVAKRND